jgi:hypothetical protein
MKKQSNMTLPKAYNSSITKCKDTEVMKILVEKFKSLVFKMINDLKKDLNKQE